MPDKAVKYPNMVDYRKERKGNEKGIEGWWGIFGEITLERNNKY